MRATRILVPALMLVAAVSAVTALAATRSRAIAAHESRLERGRYLTQLGGCNDCHTPGTFYGDPDFDRQLSGSELGWVGPWGVSFPRNLTPDVETGIGRWSEQDIVNAIRTGMRPDGSVLAPPMPWPNYATMTDDDAFAIAAYLKSLKPVSHRVPDKVAPGVEYHGAALSFPAPPAWDAPHTTASGAAH
jgi:mono/diheme cytochrome c family protein